jgi:hypothetical protein
MICSRYDPGPIGGRLADRCCPLGSTLTFVSVNSPSFTVGFDPKFEPSTAIVFWSALTYTPVICGRFTCAERLTTEASTTVPTAADSLVSELERSIGVSFTARI